MDINLYEIILTDIAKEELEGIYEYIYKIMIVFSLTNYNSYE